MSEGRTAVAILGGGIAGLTVALHLQRQNTDFLLIEPERVLGGKVRTDSAGGFIIEGGPDAFLAEKPWARQLCEELGLGGEIIGTNDAQRRIFLVSRGRLRPLPDGVMMLAPVKPIPLLRSRLVSVPGVVRMAMEPFVPRRTEEGDESLGHFVRRRFGDEVFERIVDPLMSGIYAGDADQLSLDSTFPRLRDLEREHKSVIRGLIATQRTIKSRPGAPSSMFLSLRGGMARLTDAIVQRLDRQRVLTGVGAAEITRNTCYRIRLSDGRTILADQLVVATPSHVAARLVHHLDPELAALLQQIPYVSTATVSLAYSRGDVAHPLNGFGFVVPRVEQRRITACTWVSSKLPSRAPDDGALLRCFIGRAGDEDWVSQSDDELVQRARGELQALMGITAAPLLWRVFRWERSMPQYRVGHQQLIGRIEARLSSLPGLVLTGSAYRGVGLPDVIREAFAAAAKVDRPAAEFRAPAAR